MGTFAPATADFKLTVELANLGQALNVAMQITRRTGDEVPELTALMPELLGGLKERIIESFESSNIRTSGRLAKVIRQAEEECDPANPFFGTLVIKSAAAKALEFGTRPFDMKPGLLSGPKARTSKDGGRYNIIRFQHGTESTATTGTGLTGGDYKPRMPPEIKKAAEAAGGKPIAAAAPWGMRSSTNIERLLKTDKAAWKRLTGERMYRGMGAVQHGYTWKASPWAGLRKESTGHQTSYATYRAVSDKSDPYSWIHPGIDAKYFIRNAIMEFQQEAAMMTSMAISNFFTRITEQYGNA